MGWGFKEIARSPSKTLAALCAVFCLGILVGPLFLSVSYDLLLVLTLIPAMVAVFTSNKTQRLLLLLVTLFIFALFRYSQAVPFDIPNIGDHTGQAVRISGRIEEEIEKRPGYQRAVLGDLKVVDDSVDGRLLLRLAPYSGYDYGDQLVFQCTLKKPEQIESFRYDQYLASKKIYAICNYPKHISLNQSAKLDLIGFFLVIKEVTLERLAQIFPEPHSAFLSGLIFGGSSSLSSELKDDFAKTGTSHILAASGFNISLFTYIFLGFIIQTRLGRRRGIVLTAILGFGYVVMAGMTPAVIRAAIMASLFLISLWVRRQTSLRNMILVALSLMLLWNPLWLLFDVGFQLSFVATAAVLTLPQKLKKYFHFLPETFQIKESISASLAAIVLTLPIILWHFGEISIVAPIVNVLILPLIFPLLVLSGFALLIGFASTVVGVYAATPAWLLSSLLLHVISWFAALDFARLPLGSSQSVAVAVAILIITWLIWLYKHPEGKGAQV